MEIKDVLATARLAVEEAGLPEQWQERAFAEVREASSARRPAGPAPPTAVPRPGATAPGLGAAGLSHRAARLGVSEGALADVFAIEDDNVSLHVASAKPPTTKSKATREIGLLVVVARQGAGLDDSWTDVAHVREALAQYNRYDASNFSKYLRHTGDVFNLRGKPVQHLRLTRPGWEAATELVKTLTGSAQ